MMESAVEICQEFGGKQLFWSVYMHNEGAITFYKRLGTRLTRDLAFMRLDILEN
jgi:ribosomal protein S18 acetylase RimI-like enzyme